MGQPRATLQQEGTVNPPKDFSLSPQKQRAALHQVRGVNQLHDDSEINLLFAHAAASDDSHSATLTAPMTPPLLFQRSLVSP